MIYGKSLRTILREIKFRAWDKFNKRMLEVESLRFYPDAFVAVCRQEIGDAIPLSDMDCNLMQFTGLKDKNGKEIFEGDIVKFDNQYYSLKSPATVNLRPPRFWLEGETMGYEGEELIDPDQCEVIGNIWENKELLNA